MKALILEGGAMRSVHSAGALTAFTELGIPYNYFDMVFGASAGASNGAYFLADQTHQFWTMWTQTMLNNEFINLKNIFTSRTKPVIDIDFILEQVMLKAHPLDLDKVFESNTKFYVNATNCHTGKSEYFLNDKRETFYSILKASSCIPILYNKKIKINGSEYMDGAISDSIPIKKAIELGAKDIYLILTRHNGYRKKRTLPDKLAAEIYKKNSSIRESLLNRHNVYNETIEFIESKHDGINITIIRPRYNLGISRITTDPKKIRSGFLAGYHDAISVLGDRFELKNLSTIHKV